MLTAISIILCAIFAVLGITNDLRPIKPTRTRKIKVRVYYTLMMMFMVVGIYI